MPIEINTEFLGKKVGDQSNLTQEKKASVYELKIDPEFEKLIPDLTSVERMMLHNSLRKDGCRDALVTWRGTIVDGHNRYKYCKRKGIKFKVIERHWATREEVIVWMIDNQLARRNIESAMRIRLNNKRKKILADKAEERMKSGKKMEVSDELWEEYQKNLQENPKGAYDINPMEKLPQGTVRDQIGSSAGVSGRTVDMFNYIEKKDPERADALCQGRYDHQGNKITIGGVYKDLKEEERKEKLRDEGSHIEKYQIVYVDSSDSKEFRDIPISWMTQKDSNLFLWATILEIEQHLELMKSWGFQYRGMFVWDTGKPGLGRYNTAQHEMLLIGSKGELLDVECKTEPASVIKIERDGDERPQYFKKMITEMFPKFKKLDLFGSKSSDGWEVYTPVANA